MEDTQDIHPPVLLEDDYKDEGVHVYGAYQTIHPFKCSGGCSGHHQSWFYLFSRIFPCITWISQYRPSFLYHDLLSGLTVGLASIPDSIASAAIAGLPFQYGLYSSYMGPLIHVIFGSAKDVSVGLTSTLALLVFQEIHDFPPEYRPQIAVLLTFYVGIIQLLMGIVQLGFLVDFISLSVAKGFITATAIVIACEQLQGILGIEVKETTSLVEELYETFRVIGETRYWDLAMGVSCIALILCLKGVAPGKGFMRSRWYDNASFHVLWTVSNGRFFIAICGAAAVEGLLLSLGIDVLSVSPKVPTGIPPIQPPRFHVGSFTTWEIIQSFGPTLIVIPLVSLLELAAVIKSVIKGADLYRYGVHSGEFRALGLLNTVSSFFSSLPLTASLSSSEMSQSCGSKTPVSSVVQAALGLLATAFAIPLLRFIPKSALSAVIICSVLPTVDFRILGHMWRTRKSDLVAYSTTFLACFLLGLEYGILVGVMVSICVLLFPVARPIVSVYFAKRDIIFTPHGSTDFPAMRYLHELVMEHIEQRKNKPGRIIIDGSHWTDVDFTVIANMTDFISEVKNEGWQIVFHEMNEIISGTFPTTDASESYSLISEEIIA